MGENMLLDALTIFFLVAGSLLLWLNIRHRPSDVALRSVDDGDRWSKTGPSLEQLAQEIASHKAPRLGHLGRVLDASRNLSNRRKTETGVARIQGLERRGQLSDGPRREP
jgi:hypothetical protein